MNFRKDVCLLGTVSGQSLPVTSLFVLNRAYASISLFQFCISSFPSLVNETSSYLLPYLVRISFKFSPIYFVTHALLMGIRLLRLEQFFFCPPLCCFLVKKKITKHFIHSYIFAVCNIFWFSQQSVLWIYLDILFVVYTLCLRHSSPPPFQFSFLSRKHFIVKRLKTLQSRRTNIMKFKVPLLSSAVCQVTPSESRC